MAKKVNQKYFLDEDIAPVVKLFEHREQSMHISVYVNVNDFGMELIYSKETGKMGVDFGQALRQRLSRTTSFINAEAVRKLFGAQNYSEMLKRIKERFHEETAYDDLLNYLHENNIV